MTTYQQQTTEEQTYEAYEASRTNYFGTTTVEEDSLEATLNEFFQKV